MRRACPVCYDLAEPCLKCKHLAEIKIEMTPALRRSLRALRESSRKLSALLAEVE